MYELHWVAELEDVYDDPQINEEDTLELHGLKICMYPTETRGEYRKILEEQLARYNDAAGLLDDITLEAVIELHLGQIRHKATEAMNEKYRRTCTRDELERIPQ